MIFILSEDPKEISKQLCDYHLDTQTTEGIFLLTSIIDSNQYKSILMNRDKLRHPFYHWIVQTKTNYMWMYHMTESCFKEYLYRTYEEHKFKYHFDLLQIPNNSRFQHEADKITPFPKFLRAEGATNPNEVINHKKFYAKVALRDKKWTNRQKPSWLD